MKDLVMKEDLKLSTWINKRSNTKRIRGKREREKEREKERSVPGSPCEMMLSVRAPRGRMVGIYIP